MSDFPASTTHNTSWLQTRQAILSGDPFTVLDALDVATRLAIESGDNAACAALSATALAFMLVDWSRFTGWKLWIQRFADSDAQLASGQNPDLDLARANGALISALLRGDAIETLTPLGHRLEAQLDAAAGSIELTLAASALLPWMQMSRNPAAAQALHARIEATARTQPGTTPAPGDPYLRASWLCSWAQHLHFTGERERLQTALQVLDDYLAQSGSPHFKFRRTRLAAEQALFDQDWDAAERAVRVMLDAMDARRPLERVIYNAVAVAIATTRNDPERALLHATHNRRDLEAADCPPSIATVYRMVETRVYLRRGDYAAAAGIFEQLVENAHTAHAAVYRGYAALARALLAHGEDPSSRESTRELLRSGLTMARSISAVNFFFSTPDARAAVCALALREGVETEFILSSLKQAPVPPPKWADEHWPWALSLRCFGGFRSEGLATEGRAASKASNKPMSLLMLVAAHGAQGVPVALAADALWPGQDGDQAENSLSVTLLRLRRMHAEADLVERRGGWLHLNPQRVWSDVMALEAHLDALPDDAALNEPARKILIARLFDLYRGECLFGIDDEWARARAAHYRGRVTTAIKAMLLAAVQAAHLAAAEQVLTFAHERGIGAGRLLAAVSPPGQDAPPDWVRLRRHVEMLEPN